MCRRRTWRRLCPATEADTIAAAGTVAIGVGDQAGPPPSFHARTTFAGSIPVHGNGTSRRTHPRARIQRGVHTPPVPPEDIVNSCPGNDIGSPLSGNRRRCGE
jgi:hypothetical protein